MTTANINLPFITADATGPKHLDVTLTRAKFNEMTADLVERTMEPVRKADGRFRAEGFRYRQGAAGRRLHAYSGRSGSSQGILRQGSVQGHQPG